MDNHLDGKGAGFREEIPMSVQDVLPSDPFDLLSLSRLIAAQAFTARIGSLEAEAGKLKSNLGESQGSIKSLESKVSELENALRDANDKREAAEEEQAKLIGEKTALVAMVKKLNRDVAKLETFRRTLMQQLKDENDDEPASEVAMADSASKKPPLPESSTSESSGANKTEGESSSSSLAAGVSGGATGTALRVDHVARTTATASPVAVAMENVGTATGAGAAAAAAGSGGSGAVAAGDDGQARGLRHLRTPLRTPSMTPSLFSPQYTPSATPPHGSAAASPRSSQSRAPRVDGKEFFRRARNRLSYEQFSLFLANIKELNAHRKSREETLKKAEEIFGPDNRDLYASFESLLSRHLPG